MELTQIMSDALGRPIQADEQKFGEWVETAQIPKEPVREGPRKMYAEYDQFAFPRGNALVLRSILDREPRTVRAFLFELARSENQIQKAS